VGLQLLVKKQGRKSHAFTMLLTTIPLPCRAMISTCQICWEGQPSCSNRSLARLQSL
jgi:hypothetical protein